MKVLHFFDPVRKRTKFFMILILSFPEKMLLAKLGGFDKAIGTADWIESDALAGKLKFPDKEAYVFRHRRESLDFIYLGLVDKLGWKTKIKNMHSTPTYAELLANEHVVADAGMLNLYVDHELPLLDQRRRMLWATYRAKTQDDYRQFSRECKSGWPYIKVELRTTDVIVVRGYCQSGFDWLQRYFNERYDLSMKTNVLDAESYPMLLLRSSI
jgi:hypothetical protein